MKKQTSIITKLGLCLSLAACNTLPELPEAPVTLKNNSLPTTTSLIGDGPNPEQQQNHPNRPEVHLWDDFFKAKYGKNLNALSPSEENEINAAFENTYPKEAECGFNTVVDTHKRLKLNQEDGHNILTKRKFTDNGISYTTTLFDNKKEPIAQTVVSFNAISGDHAVITSGQTSWKTQEKERASAVLETCLYRK